ncbi:hypothetical protein V501_04085 [Pseudogymnoascus sp. VKM F-4519 (FW-2642)]|nr:hypothetical protein V501_04085 [Pseudogymnoascus sp. VKM F-4519 (FW-2642)]
MTSHEARNSESGILDHASKPVDSQKGICSCRLQETTIVQWIDESIHLGSVEKHLAPAAVDGYEVRFSGSSDRQDPRNFSKAKKWIIVIVLSLSSASVACDSALYTTTYDQIMDEFHCSKLTATAGLSTFILGMGISPLFLSPLSEVSAPSPLPLIWLVLCAVAKNIQTMVIARLLGGLSGAAFLSVAGASVGDLFDHHELQFPMTIYSGIQFMGPELGPIVGGFINYNATWHWTYYFMLIWTGFALVLTLVFVPETYHPVLLLKRAEKLRKETGDDRYHVGSGLRRTKSVLETITWSFLRPLEMLLFEPMCLSLCLAIGILFGISTTPYWQKNYQQLVKNRHTEASEDGKPEPEYRLPQVIVGSVLVPAGLFWFGFTTYTSVHWIVPVIGSGLFGMGCSVFLSFSGTWTFLVDAYPLYAASALAANSFARSTFAAIFPLFGIQMYERLGFDWATAVLAFITLAMVPFPFIFFKYGKKIRGKSRFASTFEGAK